MPGTPERFHFLVLHLSKPCMKGAYDSNRWTMPPWVIKGQIAGITFLLVIPNDSALRVSGWLFEVLELRGQEGLVGWTWAQACLFSGWISPALKPDSLFLVDAAPAIKVEHFEGI